MVTITARVAYSGGFADGVQTGRPDRIDDVGVHRQLDYLCGVRAGAATRGDMTLTADERALVVLFRRLPPDEQAWEVALLTSQVAELDASAAAAEPGNGMAG